MTSIKSSWSLGSWGKLTNQVFNQCMTRETMISNTNKSSLSIDFTKGNTIAGNIETWVKKGHQCPRADKIHVNLTPSDGGSMAIYLNLLKASWGPWSKNPSKLCLLKGKSRKCFQMSNHSF